MAVPPRRLQLANAIRSSDEREEQQHRRHADGLLDVLLPVPDNGDRLRTALADLLLSAVGLFDPVTGEAEAVATGVAVAPFGSRLDEWTDRVRRRFDVDPAQFLPAAPTGRLDRHPDFGPLLIRMREVMDLDPAAIW